MDFFGCCTNVRVRQYLRHLEIVLTYLFPMSYWQLLMMSSAAPAYGVYICQLIQYSRACGSYYEFLDRGLQLTRKLMNQGFLVANYLYISWSSLWMFYCCHHDYLCQKWPWICSVCHNHNPILSWLLMTCHRVNFMSLMEQELHIPFRSFTWVHPQFLVGLVLPSLYFSVYCILDHCPFVLRFAASRYPFSIYKHFF